MSRIDKAKQETVYRLGLIKYHITLIHTQFSATESHRLLHWVQGAVQSHQIFAVRQRFREFSRMVNRKSHKAKSISKTTNYFNLYILPNPKMLITGNQIISFFQDVNQMGLGNRTRIFLQEEDITTVGYLVDFTEDKIWSQVIENFKRPPHLAPFHIAEKLLMRLKVTAVSISYYEWTSCPLNAGNIKWDPHSKNFSV